MDAWRELVAAYETGSGVDAGALAAARLPAPQDAPAPEPDDRPWLAATLPALHLALGSVEAVRRAAVRAGASGPLATAPLEPDRIAAAFSSERLFRLDGLEVEAFAPLSGFFRTADGWVRTHANYPHHRTRLLALLGLHDGASREEAAATIARRSAQALEDGAARSGAIVVRVRTEEEWRASDMGRAAGGGPLVRVEARDDGPLEPGRHESDRTWDRARDDAAGTPEDAGGLARHAEPRDPRRPLAGLRVLDLTRVLAGPVATRTLALLGAQVLRVDPPVPAEIRWVHLDTGHGKRTALLDLRGDGDLERAHRLLADADVLVTGYRPGSLEALGLRVPPGVVHARVDAWGGEGPWAQRRGFDSIVQAASGIAVVEGGAAALEGGRPAGLPAQALDHGSGYLLAAGVIDALLARRADGRGRDVSVSLARTAAWLLDPGVPDGGRDPGHPPAAAVPPEAATSHGRAPIVTTARPALPGFDDYLDPARKWGSDHASWV
ncbi:CoA transferase [Puerhibacterium sp. TATVAM-FAB25]|uniref:CoA transferase n=1 Tax=Puerhibacterium sp. TATVAM-FAB25 TaxID=3093699 RepID=UPI00397B3E3A